MKICIMGEIGRKIVDETKRWRIENWRPRGGGNSITSRSCICPVGLALTVHRAEIVANRFLVQWSGSKTTHTNTTATTNTNTTHANR